ncbi:MAG: tetratricopeptide repeat protein [Gemmataceae bacterium]|nr:tetratricopeptide repeat protein [Gemmataceae bacterium]
MRHLPTLAAVAASFLAAPSPARAVDPVTLYVVKYIGEYAAGKALDALFDSGGKPDLKEIDKRLLALERDACLRGEMKEEVRRLREGLGKRLTKDEFKKAMAELGTELGSIRRRLAGAEERIERLEVQNADLRDGTKNAARPATFLRRAYDFKKAGDPHRAIANCSVALGLDEKLADAHVSRGEAWESLKAPAVAMIDYSAALALDPKCLAALRHRARLRCEAGDHAGTVADCDACLEIKAGDGLVLGLRAHARTKRGELDAAARDWEACLEQRPDFADGWSELGSIQLRKGQHRKALASFNQAIRHGASVAAYHAGRAWTRRAMGDAEGAVKDADRAIDLDGKCASAYEVRGLCRWTGDPAKDGSAVADVSRAIALGSKRADLRSMRGRHHHLAGRWADAVADLDEALRSGEKTADLYRCRGESLHKLGRNADAARDLTAAIKARPAKADLARAHWWRSQARLGLGDRASYREDLDQAVALDPAWQKGLVAGDVRIVNESKTPVTVVLDRYAKADGGDEVFVFRYPTKFAAGESAHLLYDGKQIVAREFRAYVETAKGRKLIARKYERGASLEVRITGFDLP